MSSRQLKTEQLDMDSFFDFNAGTQSSPTAASSSKNDLLSPYDEERQQFNGPSHDYGQFKQQVGLPGGSMHMSQNSGLLDGFNSGIGDMDLNMGWNTGLDLDADMNMDFNTSAVAPIFFPNSTDAPSDKFVNPSSVAAHEEPASSVGRLWPGMHSQQAQQAAMQKHAVQQRQMKIQAQQAQYRHASHSSQSSQGSSQQSHANAKRASHISEPHVEESISRLLNQMRNNASPSDDPNSPNGIPASIARMKKDEEDMDEDERLLASEEGKKLSSKERRQLRNKVSARAFRSRRKEYISQLEGEVALKTQEANTFRHENQQLIQENERYRGLIETLLRHPAFTPFINDISQDPSVLGMPQRAPQPQPQQQQPQPQSQPQPQRQQPTPNPPQEQPQQQQQQQQQQQDIKPDFMSFDPSQIQIPQQPEQLQVGLTMVPDNDFSKLNINGFKSMNFNNFNVQSAYAVTDITAGPDPVDLLIDSPVRLPHSAYACSTARSTDSALTVLLAKLDGTARRMQDRTTVA